MQHHRGQFVLPRSLWWAILLLAALLVGISRLLHREPNGLASVQPPFDEQAEALETVKQQSPAEMRIVALPEATVGVGVVTDPRQEASKLPVGPISSLGETVEQQKLLYEAEEAEVAKCMRQKGFDYTINQFVPEDGFSGPFPRFDPADTEAASVIGYGLADALELEEPMLPVDANDRRREAMSESQRSAWETALRGVELDPTDPDPLAGNPALSQYETPSGNTITWDGNSCIARARAALYGSDRYVELDIALKSLRSEASMRAKSNPKQVAAQAKWRQCMTSKGYALEAPGEASASLIRDYKEHRLALEDLRSRETTVATDDSTCFVEADLPSIQVEALFLAERETAEDAQETINAIRRMRARALEYAQRLTLR